jgi:hypothetical protein
MRTPLRRSPATRLAIRLAACAVIGAAVTIVVAWALLVWIEITPMRFSLPERRPVDVGEWPRRVPSDWPPFAARVRAEGSGPARRVTWIGNTLSKQQVGTPERFVLSLIQRGWPVVALESRAYLGPGGTQRWKWMRGISIPGWTTGKPPSWIRPRPPEHFGSPFLPVVPVWPGFALDTAFYGAIAFALWSAPGLIRRRLRRARGHCPACGYNLEGAPTATCPECGS